MKPSTFLVASTRKSSLCVAASFVLSLACADDNAVSNPTTDPSASSSASQTPDSDAAASATASAAPQASACETIGAHCMDYASTELGSLCVKLAEEGNAESCDAIVNECTEYCGPAGVLPTASVETSTLTAETCDQTIGDPCHEFDKGAGLGHLCHQVGHQGNISGCVALYDECVALCGSEHEEHAEGDTHQETEGSDAGHAVSDAAADVLGDAALPL